MADLKKKNIFTMVLGGAGATIIIVSLFSILLILAAGNSPKRNLPSNVLSVYVVSGKIIDIQGKTIILETPVFDSANRRWDKDKKEARKLTVGNETELLKNNYEWEEEKKKFKTVSNKIKTEDLKIGDRLDANYTENLIEIKDFMPTRIAILPN